MENLEVIEEIHGTIIGIDEYPTSKKDTRRRLGITIQPDDPKRKPFSEANEERDYSQFQIGQRVVYVVYTWMRPATIDDKHYYYQFYMRCPDEIREVDYMTYDEANYEEIRQFKNNRNK